MIEETAMSIEDRMQALLEGRSNSDIQARMGRLLEATVPPTSGQNLTPGSTIQVLKMKGSWWAELTKGSKLQVQKVEPHERGAMVTLKTFGAGNRPFDLLMPTNQNSSGGEFTLVDTNIRRGLLVKKV